MAAKKKFRAAPKLEKTVIVLPDLHDAPGLCQDRFKWIGQYLNDEQPDAVINIGDTADLESLCSHVKNESWEGKFKPSFLSDLESLNKSLELINQHYKPENKPVRHITLGNHEHRAWTFVSANPEMYGVQDLLTKTLEQNGWTWSKYGEYFTYENVDFTHVPFGSGMGKPIGGKTAMQRIANESIRDLVFGHTHRFGYFTTPKLGPDRKVTVVNVGCGLPWGKVQDYARLASTGWWWGIVKLSIKDGAINGFEQIPMYQLENAYK